MAGAFATLLGACAAAKGDAATQASGAGDTVTAVAGATTGPAEPAASAPVDATVADTAPATKLAPLADTIAQRLVFVPLGQDWFTAAGRAKRLLVDLGRELAALVGGLDRLEGEPGVDRLGAVA
ncbi:MAG: hypothetical protein ACLGIK_07615, partial [Gemmatimonadota bacterium]